MFSFFCHRIILTDLSRRVKKNRPPFADDFSVFDNYFTLIPGPMDEDKVTEATKSFLTEAGFAR